MPSDFAVSPQDNEHRVDEPASGAEAPALDSTESAERLEKARRAVAEGETIMQDQRDLLARLENLGVDTSEARAVLDTLAKRQAGRLENLAYLMRQFSSAT